MRCARAALVLLACLAAEAQTFHADWRRLGNTTVEASLASPAGGPVERVWYSGDGKQLFVRTAAGSVFVTRDFDTWDPAAATASPAADDQPAASSAPEPGVRIRRAARRPELLYAAGRAVYRSDDGGASWRNLTDFEGASILGGGFRDLAVSPENDQEIVVAGRFGVWRSLDGGLSWAGLNRSLPNLPVRRILRLPGGGGGMRVLLENFGAVEWAPGEKTAWRPVADEAADAQEQLSRALRDLLDAPIGPVAVAGDSIYAGSSDGRLWASSDRGRTWRPFTLAEPGPVRDIFASVENPRTALAAAGDAGGRIHVLKTTNGGIFWDDITGDLPDVATRAVTADLASGAVYVGGDAGVYFTFADLRGAGAGAAWSPVAGRLAGRRVFDLALDSGGNQLFAAVDGEGVYSTMAPHRFFDPKVVNAADLSSRPASPGALLSVLGRWVAAARAGTWMAPVLAASAAESQIQVPFEVAGNSLTLALMAIGRSGQLEPYNVGLALRRTAPAIFVDRDGSPMVLDAETGVLLDAMTPARPGGRIQILATGLGKVQPDWPSGLPGPLEDPPRVVADVRVYLDRTPLEVTRAILAPGYVGFYLVEAQLPEILNAGPAELMIEAGGEQSNRTRIYLEP